MRTPTRFLGLVLTGCGLVALATPARAWACGEAPTPWYTVDRQAPQGEGVLLDAPLVVELLETSASPDEASLPDYQLELSVVGSEQLVPLTPRRPGGDPRLTFVPEKPLLPLTTYRASFRTHQTLLFGGAAPAQPTLATWEFTTGADSSEPLALDGALEVTLAPGQDPVYTCKNDCGDCVETSKVAVTQAVVSVPRVVGGVPGKYFGTLALTSDTPRDFTPPDKAEPREPTPLVSLERPLQLSPDGPTTLQLTLPGEAQPYTPCFALQVADDRGHLVLAKPVCLTDTFPSTLGAGGDGAGGGSAHAGNSGVSGSYGNPYGQPMGDDTVHPKTSSSCSLSGAPRGGVWLLVVAAFVLNRRRRSRSAP